MGNPKWDNQVVNPGTKIVRAILAEFCTRFTPGGKLVWVMGTDGTILHRSQAELDRCGIHSLPKTKVPSVGIHDTTRGWLVLVDAANSRRMMTTERCESLMRLFSHCPLRLSFVTAFRSRRDFSNCAAPPAWGTAVWCVEEPGHLIHFDGQFLLDRVPPSATMA